MILILFLVVLFSDEKYQKSHKVVPALCILPASACLTLCEHLSPSGANIASEPSRYSVATATGSKRSSADSDSLLCHVRLWRTSRLSFWQKFGCEHSEIGFILIVPPAHILDPRCPVSATPTHMLRICVNSPTKLTGRRRRRPLQSKVQVQPIDKINNMLSIPSARKFPHVRTKT